MNEQQMNEQQMRQIMATTVAVTTAELSDTELIVLNLVAQLDQNPHDRKFDYKLVEGLFTEDGGTKMHSETKIALANVVNYRLK